jgi:glucose-1-phosphate thymidylyltransferase
MIICAPDHIDDFLQLLGSGKEFGVRFEYTVQEEPSGIAQGLSLAENFAAGNNVALVLGDNIFFDTFNMNMVKDFQQGACIFVKEVPDPERFGVVELNGNEVISIEEKPEKPRSSYAQTGLYFYDTTVFDRIRRLKPSGRNELEITDLNNLYLKDGNLHARILQHEWLDAGTFESLFLASELVRKNTQK